MGYKGIIFDLDGTLIDSLEDLAYAANVALKSFNYNPHPLENYRYFVGEGLETLMKRAAPVGTPEDILNSLVKKAGSTYKNRWSHYTKIYPGIDSFLADAELKGVAMAVLTNKRDEFAHAVVGHYFPGFHFKTVIGSPVGEKAKPDPKYALKIAEKFNLEPSEIMFVGDTKTDIQTALSAGMVPVGVLWGFRPEEELVNAGAKYIVDHPDSLTDLI